MELLIRGLMVKKFKDTTVEEIVGTIVKICFVGLLFLTIYIVKYGFDKGIF